MPANVEPSDVMFFSVLPDVALYSDSIMIIMQSLITFVLLFFCLVDVLTSIPTLNCFHVMRVRLIICINLDLAAQGLCAAVGNHNLLDSIQ